MAAEQKNGIEDSVAPSCLEGPFFSQTIEDLVAPSRFKEPFFLWEWIFEAPKFQCTLIWGRDSGDLGHIARQDHVVDVLQSVEERSILESKQCKNSWGCKNSWISGNSPGLRVLGLEFLRHVLGTLSISQCHLTKQRSECSCENARKHACVPESCLFPSCCHWCLCPSCCLIGFHLTCDEIWRHWFEWKD